MKRLIKNAIRRLGFDVIRHNPKRPHELESLQDLSDDELQIVASIRPFTMTSLERIAALLNAVTYLTANRIEGDIAECGVWRGGSMMAVALTLLARKDTHRSLYLYDTFEGMTAPTDIDKSRGGVSAESQLAHYSKGAGNWCYAGMEEVRANLCHSPSLIGGLLSNSWLIML